jgi:uncharacterized protein (DUF1501 family)
MPTYRSDISTLPPYVPSFKFPAIFEIRVWTVCDSVTTTPSSTFSLHPPTITIKEAWDDREAAVEAARNTAQAHYATGLYSRKTEVNGSDGANEFHLFQHIAGADMLMGKVYVEGPFVVKQKATVPNSSR